MGGGCEIFSLSIGGPLQIVIEKHCYIRAVTTIFILGGLEVTIGGGLTMVEAEELKNLF